MSGYGVRTFRLQVLYILSSIVATPMLIAFGLFYSRVRAQKELLALRRLAVRVFIYAPIPELHWPPPVR